MWSVEQRAVVARGQGHNSWVNAVAVDPESPTSAAETGEAPPRPSGSYAGDTPPSATYRFASAGADARLLLWEFNEADAVQQTARGDGAKPDEPPSALVPPPSFRAVPALLPVASAQLHLQPISAVMIGGSALLTGCVGGQVKTWARPSGEEAARC